jgi:hypothetical protein
MTENLVTPTAPYPARNRERPQALIFRDVPSLSGQVVDTRGRPLQWRFVLMAIGRRLQEFYRPLLREPLPDRQRALVENALLSKSCSSRLPACGNRAVRLLNRHAQATAAVAAA